MNRSIRNFAVGSSLLAALLLPVALAQDESAPAQPEPSEASSRAVHGLLLDVSYTGERLVAVGERGNIVASKDGQRWAQVDVPSRSALTAVSFADAKNGWAVGHDSSILHTADGGRSWQIQKFDPATHQPLLDVLFTDAFHGYAVGAFGMFFVTRDGGATWTELDAPVIREDGLHLHSLTRLNDGGLLLAGERGLLAVSADGVAWERLATPYEGTWFGAAPRGDKGAVVFGLRGNAFITDDVRAGSWQKLELGSTRTVFGGTSLPDGSAVLTGADGLLQVLRPDGRVESVAVSTSISGRSGGTLSSAVAWPGGLMTVGELGIQSYRIQ